MNTQSTSKMNVIGWILSVIVVLMLVMSGVMKLAMPPSVAEGFTHLGWPPEYATRLGVVELFCAIIYIIPRTRVLGAILVTGYLGGAVATHARIGEAQLLGAAILGIATWFGLFLRDRRIRELLPLNTPPA